MTETRTRFAPSPTGFLHIGGVRTALFNWLFARRHGGRYILRIDDTDAERNIESALAPILRGFHWLGLHWDEGPEIGGPHAPYFQSRRTHRYQAAVDRLIGSGHAYRDYATPEEMDAERRQAKESGQSFIYSRRFAAETNADRARFEAEGRRSVVRLKMPRDGVLVLKDLIRGEVTFTWSLEQDHVVQRQDGSFIYHLASVVDDHDFRITHVLRAEEHLPNTPRQVFMVQALGYPLPVYGHLPYVAEPGSKSKLSKRKLDKYLKNPDFASIHEHGLQIARALGLATSPETFNPVATDFYEQTGYLPDAVLNYLLLLGWSLDDRTEFLTREQMVEHFTLDRVNPAPASFDPAKLLAFQAHYMKQLPSAEKVKGCVPFLQRAGLVRTPITPEVEAYVGRLVQVLGDRIKVFGDIILQGTPFFGRDVPSWDEKAFAKRVLAPGAVDLLGEYRNWLKDRNDFTASALERDTHAWLAERRLDLRDLVHGVRVATTGVANGPGLFDCLALLGRDVCLHRLDEAIAKAQTASLSR
jgi:glutamyl-tRNA synthetase